MATLKLINVNKTQGQLTILKGINLAIQKGEFVAVVGPSGSGKSTLLRIVAGLEPLTSGEVRLNGQALNEIPPAARNMAMVFQHYALYPHMTVYDNMAYGLKMRKLDKDSIRRKILAIAETLQLTELLSRKPAALSGGQRQRVAMGRAMVREPAVFLFDEPLSNLDVKLRTQMRHDIKKLHQTSPTTSLYVTHDQTEAMSLADRIVVLNQGQVEQEGTPLHLYQYPETLFVAGFIGHYPTNFLSATLNLSQKRVDCDLGFSLPWPSITKSVYDGQAVMIAIRSEHWLVNQPFAPHAISAKMEFIDDMGADKLVQVIEKNTSTRLTVRIAEDIPIESEQISISVNPIKANVFCQQTGFRIGGWNA